MERQLSVTATWRAFLPLFAEVLAMARLDAGPAVGYRRVYRGAAGATPALDRLLGVVGRPESPCRTGGRLMRPTAVTLDWSASACIITEHETVAWRRIQHE